MNNTPKQEFPLENLYDGWPKKAKEAALSSHEYSEIAVRWDKLYLRMRDLQDTRVDKSAELHPRAQFGQWKNNELGTRFPKKGNILLWHLMAGSTPYDEEITYTVSTPEPLSFFGEIETELERRIQTQTK